MLQREQGLLETNGICVDRQIGSGSFARVYAGQWTKKHEGNEALQVINISVKVMRLDEISDPRFERYFLRREIEIVQKLNHPNIAKVLTVFEADQSIMLIGELYQCDLLQYIQQRGVIGERVARRLIKELCGAVHFLHSNDVVHRDLKTENIFLAQNGQVKLGDFGFAREVSKEYWLVTTRCGSDGYIAPEVAINDHMAIDPKLADVWSIGVILYSMVTKTIPFDKKDYTIMAKTKIVLLRFPTGCGVAFALRDFISKFLRFQPEKRIRLSQVLSDPWISETNSSQTTNQTQSSTTDRRSSAGSSQSNTSRASDLLRKP